MLTTFPFKTWLWWFGQLAVLTVNCCGLSLYDFGNPTAEEQHYLELINRARANPVAEAARLAAITDPQIVAAYTYFNVNLPMMQDEFSALSAQPPLAPNGSLTTTARNHSAWMLATAIQAHNETNPANTPDTRMTAAGYSYVSAAENIYASAKDVEYGLAGFEVDWGGGGTGGMLAGRGHRVNLFSATFREIGVGVVLGSNGAAGPQVVTQDFGTRAASPAFGTGVAYYDLNSNDFYDPGEGISDLAVNVSGSGVTQYCITATGGGWVVPIPNTASTRTVTFSGLNMNRTASLVIPANRNAKADLKLTYAPPAITSPADASAGNPHTLTFTAVGGATAYRWDRWAITAAAGENCESSANITATTTGTYPVLNTTVKQQGAASFHLENTTAASQVLQLSPLYFGRSSPALTFQSSIRYATSAEQFKVQIKEEGSVVWQDVFSQTGTNTAGEAGFFFRSADLSAMTGKAFRVRFVLSYGGGGYYTTSGDRIGWFMDAINFSGVDALTNTGSETLAGTSGSFTPNAGACLMSVTPVISNRDFPAAYQTLDIPTDDLPRVWYVSLDGNDTGAGTSWSAAKRTVQAAVDAAAQGDTVVVADGAYSLTSSILLTKPITLTSVNGSSATILDAQQAGRGVTIDGIAATLNGFTIRNGRAGVGGGVYCNGGTITNCVITGNQAIGNDFNGGMGGGVYLAAGTMDHCVVDSNVASTTDSYATAWGGGVYCYGSVMHDSVISNNQSNADYANGGGVVLIGGELRNSRIVGNSVTSLNYASGGGVYASIMELSVTSVVEACQVANNNVTTTDTYAYTAAHAAGGGMYIGNGTTVRSTLVTRNTARAYAGYTSGGGIQTSGSTVENCTVAYNDVATYFGHVGAGGGWDPIVLNDLGVGGGVMWGYNDQCYNNIIKFNSANNDPDNGDVNVFSYPTFVNSDIGPWVGVSVPSVNKLNCIAADPLFVNAAAGDFRLQAASPCRNAGTNRPWSSAALDLDGNARIADGVTDIGAFEFGNGDAGVAAGITAQPANQTVTAGQHAAFSITAEGTPAPTFQWQVSTNFRATWSNLADDATYSGVNLGTLSVNTSTALNGYSYRCVVTNPTGTATSQPVLLTVNVPLVAPSITMHPANLSVNSGQTANLTVAASGTPAPTFQWYAGSSGVTTEPIAGASAASFTTPALTSEARYWVRASNAAGTADSATVTVSISRFTLITSGAHGTITGDGSYDGMAQAVVSATPDPGYVFSGWTGDASGTTNPLSLLMDSNKNVGAIFTPDDPFIICFVGTPVQPRVGNQITLDLNRLITAGQTIKLIGKLPGGLKFNAASGLLTGILTGKAGSYQLSVQVLQDKTIVRTVSLPLSVLAFPSSLIGNFDCLLEDADAVPTGAFRLTITGANVWTATLEMAGAAKRSAKGKFTLALGSPVAPITAVFPATSTSPAVTVNVAIDGSSSTIGGTYDGGTMRGFRLASGVENPPATVAYSLVLDPGIQDGITVPAGLGWLKGTVSKLGTGTLKGLLGDGTAAKITLHVSAAGQAVLWAQPYTNKNSYIGGIVTLANLGQPSNENEMLTDNVWWTKVADPKTLSYPDGFAGMPVALGTSRWLAPATASALGASLGWRNDRTTAVTIDGAGLSNQIQDAAALNLPTEFTLDDKFNLAATAPAGPRVAWTGKAVKSDGSFAGSLTLPAGFGDRVVSGAAAASGVLLQDESWDTTTGCGLVKVPVSGAKGSFRTAALRLGQ